jgi:hypothetical protein
VTICPCCGFKFQGDLREGCKGCGARSVGEPLPKPARELPAYGRPLLLAISGTVMVLGFLVETVIAFAQNVPLSFGFWSWVAAGETAAWRLKWIAVPAAIIALWGGRRVYRSIMRTPARFVGINIARRGLLASALITLLIATLIGVTVPARMEQRQLGLDAAVAAQIHTIARAQLEYQALHGTVALNARDLLDLPDSDGSIAAAVAGINIDPAFYKTSGADVAVVGPKTRPLAGALLSDVSVSPASEPPVAGLSITSSYEFRLAGDDKIMNTDDDLIVRDGVIYKASESKELPVPVRAPARPRKR